MSAPQHRVIHARHPPDERRFGEVPATGRDVGPLRVFKENARNSRYPAAGAERVRERIFVRLYLLRTPNSCALVSRVSNLWFVRREVKRCAVQAPTGAHTTLLLGIEDVTERRGSNAASLVAGYSIASEMACPTTTDWGGRAFRKVTFCFMGIIGTRAALKLSLPRRSSSLSASACRR